MKNKRTYKVLGLMSGTSLDGLDLALCHFSKKDHHWQYDLRTAKTVNYPALLEDRLRNAIHSSTHELERLEREYSLYLADAINEFCDEPINFIANHGHTVFHQPERGITRQIGDGKLIYEKTGIPVIYDFRSEDVSKGGQGAPLVPIVDKMLFYDYDFCLNLGGIANISFEENNQRLAYDIVPCNMLLNFYAQHRGAAYDKEGNWAQSGNVIDEVLGKWNGFNYFQQSFPKSLGYEWVEGNYLKAPITYDINDLLATAVEHISQQICNAYNNGKPTMKMLVTGGGAKNTFLIDRLKQKFDNQMNVVIPEEEIIDFKEAIAFGFLGVLRAENKINVLKSVTGASSDSCSGTKIGF